MEPQAFRCTSVRMVSARIRCTDIVSNFLSFGKMHSKSKVAVEYGVYRVEKISSRGLLLRFWLATLSRQKKVIARQFHDGVYGGEQAALLMARSYRDALFRLIPPQTQLQVNAKPRSTNTSGTPGVHGIRRQGKLVAWSARLEMNGQKWRKSFSIAHHGEENAKTLAVAARMHMLRNADDRFATMHPQATDSANAQFGDLLGGVADTPQQAAVQVDLVARQKHLQALNDWFDALRPRHVHVRVTTYSNIRSQRKMLDVMISDGGQVDKPRVRAWSLLNVSYEECLPQVWIHIEERLTALFGSNCWSAFKKNYRADFFASNPSDGFFVRYRYDDLTTERLRQPPPLLAELLPGFEIPKL